MPINSSKDPLASIKLGESDILKGYIGSGQIFPNNAEITSAAFTDSNISNNGGNTNYVVAGDIGATFTLTGSNGASISTATRVLSGPTATYQILIGDQSNICGSTQRSPQIVIAPQGDTVLANGVNNTDTILQAAGPAYNPVTTSLTLSASVYDNVVVTQNGTKYWGQGAQVRFNITVSTNSTLSSIRLQGISPSAGSGMAINPGFGGSTTGPGNGYVWDDYLPDSDSGYNTPYSSGAPYAIWNSTPATNGLPSGISMIFYNSGQGLLTNMGATLTLTGNAANCDQLSNTTLTTRLYPV